MNYLPTRQAGEFIQIYESLFILLKSYLNNSLFSLQQFQHLEHLQQFNNISKKILKAGK